jgi:opacity protein-like surface antigen
LSALCVVNRGPQYWGKAPKFSWGTRPRYLNSWLRAGGFRHANYCKDWVYCHRADGFRDAECHRARYFAVAVLAGSGRQLDRLLCWRKCRLRMGRQRRNCTLQHYLGGGRVKNEGNDRGRPARRVIGIETDFQKSWQKLSGRGNGSLLYNSVGIANPAINETDDIDWFGTTRLRFGVAPERILFYGTAGVAYASIRTRSTSGAGVTLVDGTPVRIGWAFGGGIEAMLTRNWTARAEYLRLDFGGYTEGWVYAGTTAISLHQRVTDDIVRAGVNYYFR